MFTEIRMELTSFIEQSGKSQRQISKETGLSTSVISQFLEGTYSGNNEKIAQSIQQYLIVGKERLNSKNTLCFYESLYNTQEVLFACNHAHLRNDIALVSGDAGAGKTTALEHYTRTNTGVIMVTASSCTNSATAILKLIAEKLGRTEKVNRSVLMKDIVSQLAGSNRLLIIDEADHLTLHALQAVRNINDLAKIGIVLSGNDRIYRQMFTGQRGYEFDQIRTRILVRKRVENNYTAEELQQIFPNISDECIGFLLDFSDRESLRSAKKLFEIAMEYADAMNQKICLNVLKKTKKELFGGF